MRLSGRVAVVTGSGNGIGKAIAGGLAREGAKVVIADLDSDAAKRTEAEIRNAGGEVMAAVTDVSSEESTRSMVQQVIAAYGKVDILVNDAAHPPLPRKPWHELSLEEWSKPFNVDLRGCFFVLKGGVSAHEGSALGPNH